MNDCVMSHVAHFDSIEPILIINPPTLSSIGRTFYKEGRKGDKVEEINVSLCFLLHTNVLS